MRKIEIGLNVHKAIEAGRISLAETENDILERLLNGARTAVAVRMGRPWRRDGLQLEHGTELRAVYSEQTVQGIVEDGQWKVGDHYFTSPSQALIANVRTRAGKTTSINGWNYWQAKRPGEQTFRLIGQLRPVF